MRTMVGRLLFSICVLVSITGCWDHKVMQDISYISALGIDYVDDQFVVYTQVMDFSTVGKMEGAKGEPNLWVNKGAGSSFALAFNDLYNSSQQRTFVGHNMTVVFTDKALQKDLVQTMDTFERYTEARYTPLLYTTLEPIGDLFSLKSIFPSTPLITLLHAPEGNYKQHSMIRPIKMLEFAALYRERSASISIPTLAIDKKKWKKGESKLPVMTQNGAIFIHLGKKPRWMSKDDLLGMRWLEEKTARTPLTLNDNKGHIKALLPCEDPKVKISSEIASNGEPVYNILIKVRATVNQLNVKMTIDQLRSEARASIESEIRSTFAAGQKNNVDVYHLEENMFRKRYEDWKKLTTGQDFPMSKVTLGDIKVDVAISDAGKKKLK
ncbi:germination protein, Ger(x)C family [Paenibacillus sp. yr247]|uniref:Ger(x)C family spore germination protein n=1 Tax=Paenibacillus sp. yr247 TaxID=1761880 RepID=UPI00088BD867|nr:Ger(x)C family spore germination protein [Paenibacillus sp. yr247]SDO79105.1 germination protein, Ger(x)C family [Paenibacillus sp. yr247]